MAALGRWLAAVIGLLSTQSEQLRATTVGQRFSFFFGSLLPGSYGLNKFIEYF